MEAGYKELERAYLDSGVEPGGELMILLTGRYLEREPMEGLAAAGELMAYRHSGFWQCMDTARDHALLNRLWRSDDAPWKTW